MAEKVKKVGFFKSIEGFFKSIQWFFNELMKIYSTQDSYFSKKRVESGIGFVIAEWGMIFFLLKKIDEMTASDFAIWASIQFVVAGYIITQIQKEKNTEGYESYNGDGLTNDNDNSEDGEFDTEIDEECQNKKNT